MPHAYLFSVQRPSGEPVIHSDPLKDLQRVGPETSMRGRETPLVPPPSVYSSEYLPEYSQLQKNRILVDVHVGLTLLLRPAHERLSIVSI